MVFLKKMFSTGTSSFPSDMPLKPNVEFIANVLSSAKIMKRAKFLIYDFLFSSKLEICSKNFKII